MTRRGTFCTGGQTSGEIWTPPFSFAARRGHKTQEHCAVYNMIRLADVLYRWSGDPAHLDYIEANLHNGLLAQQHPETGMPAYFLPLEGGARKQWGTPTEDFWCCHGSLVQAHTRVAFEEGLAEPRQQGLRKDRKGGDGQLALVEAADGLGRADDAFQAGVGTLHFVVQRQPLGGGRQTAALAIEQLESKQMLEARQLAAHGGLRGEQQARGAGDAAGGHHGAEDFDMANGKVHGTLGNGCQYISIMNGIFINWYFIESSRLAIMTPS